MYSLLPLKPDAVLEHGNAIISAILAPSLGNAAAMSGGGIEVFAAKALGAILSNLSHPVVKALIKDVWETALVGERPLGGDKWKVHFLGETGKMVQFLTWALEAQLKDFFGSLVDVLKGVADVLKEKAEAKKRELEATEAAKLKNSTPA